MSQDAMLHTTFMAVRTPNPSMNASVNPTVVAPGGNPTGPQEKFLASAEINGLSPGAAPALIQHCSAGGIGHQDCSTHRRREIIRKAVACKLRRRREQEMGIILLSRSNKDGNFMTSYLREFHEENRRDVRGIIRNRIKMAAL